MLVSRFRRSRFTLLFERLIILTTFVYALLNVLTDTLNRQQQQQPHDADQFATITVTNTVSSTQHPMPTTSINVVRTFGTGETTELFSISNSENATDYYDGQADEGVVRTVTVRSRGKVGDVEQRVRRETARLRLRPPKSVQYSYGQWQIVDDVGGQVYIYSAYYDTRPDIDWPQVRVIAVAEYDVEAYGLCCLLWYRSRRLPDVAEISVLQAGQTSSPNGRTILTQFIFSCRLDSNKTDAPPTSVSLVGPRNFRLSNLLPVQVPERPERVIELGHCMSVRYWKQDAFQLVEWLEAHRMWGVGEVNIYVTQIDNVTDSILTRYSADSGFVNYRQSPGPVGDYNEHSILLAMSPVINDCMYRNLYRYRYVVCTDPDEMIVPAGPHHNYSEMLTAAAAAAARVNAVIHSYMFRNTYFFLDFGATEKKPWYLLTQRYTKRIRPSRFGYSAKSITRTLSCVALQNHLCWESLPSYTGQPNWNVDVPLDVGKSQHYKKCHFDEFLKKNGVCHRMMTRAGVRNDRTMLRFGETLSNVVANKLHQLGLTETPVNDSWKTLHRVF